MIDAHPFFSTLAPAAVFDVLRHFGSALDSSSKDNEMFRLLKRKNRFDATPPPLKIAKSFLHFAWESQRAHNSILANYLFFNKRALMAVSNKVPPDYTGWDVAANQILDKISDEVNIFSQNGQWRIVCTNPQYSLVPEIDALLQFFDPAKSVITVTGSSNVLINTNINAGNDVHIGNIQKTYFPPNFLPTPAMVAQGAQFSAQMQVYLQENKVEEAINSGLIYTQLLYPVAHEEITAIRLNLQSLSKQYHAGQLSLQVVQTKWDEAKTKLAEIVSALTTWK